MTPRRLSQLTRKLVSEIGCQNDAAQALVDAGLRASFDGALSAIKRASTATQERECLWVLELICLEEFVGEAIVSREIAAQHHAPTGGDILTASAHLSRDAAELTEMVVEATSPESPGGRDLTPNELDKLQSARDAAFASLRTLDAALAGRARLRVVAAE